MKKRVISLIMTFVMIFTVCFCVSASAAESNPLRFDENGEFKIMHICDCQDNYPASEKMLKYIDAALKTYKPDIVVLGGDNSVEGYVEQTDEGEIKHIEYKDDAIKELVSVFVENETYFTLVFGNHDREQGMTNDELLPLYQQFGGKYCLAYDPVPSLHGTATHNLPVLSKDGTKIKFNLWMFDSGSHVYDDNGNDLGYDSVTPDQIEWYENTSKALEIAAGEKVPSVAFQHIIVGEVYDALFKETSIDMGELSREFNGKRYSFLPKTENLIEGTIFEFPCPGYYNHGQFDAMVNRGDVLATLSGHDHTNTFVTEYKGVKIINTSGATYHAYGNDLVRGARMITVKENDNWNFETEIVTVNQLALDNADFAESVGINSFVAKLTIAVTDILIALGKFSGVFSKIF